MSQSEGEADVKRRRGSNQGSMRPRDAATLVIIDQSTGETRLLMGRRRHDQVFLPSKYVFPGGAVERADRFAPCADALRPSEAAKLVIAMRGVPSPSRARALALAAARETFEETGLLIGERGSSACGPSQGAWSRFLAQGVVPKIGAMTYFARAITPPGRPRRYDTRFFCLDASAIAHRIEAVDGELSALDWFTFNDIRALDLPGITRVVVEDLWDRLEAGLPGPDCAPVPFYFQRNGASERVLLAEASGPT
jgi:8-oxo-dGTP pyrophosphatase MutT (NUDIX family)